MKCITLIFLITVVSVTAFAQDSPVMDGDTLRYAGKKFWTGQQLKLGNGSGVNKEFIFITFGSALAGVSSAPAGWAKTIVKVDKVYKQRGRYLLRAKIDVPGPGRVFADVELAVDNKEL